jgi:hypothetical protein
MKCPYCLMHVPSGVKTCRNCAGDVTAIDSMRFDRNMLFAVLSVGIAFIGGLLVLTFR